LRPLWRLKIGTGWGEVASVDLQANPTRLIEDLPVADQPDVFGELRPFPVSEVVNEREHELAGPWIFDEPKPRASLREVDGAAMVIEDHCVPDEHRDLEDLGELFWWRSVGLQEERLHEREESGGHLQLLHGVMVATFSVEVEVGR
jgi:hypothetical protein